MTHRLLVVAFYKDINGAAALAMQVLEFDNRTEADLAGRRILNKNCNGEDVKYDVVRLGGADATV